MAKQVSIQNISEHYNWKHKIRTGMYGKPYANFGYWPREGMTIDEACDAMSELMAREAGIQKSDCVLECGCGYGVTDIYLATKYGPRKIIGIDVTELRIEAARKMINESGLGDRVEVRFGDATALDFEDCFFTKVIAIECAFHFDTRLDFFKQAFRVLKPGGVLAMTDIIPSSSINLSEFTYDELRDFISANAKLYCDANLYNAETYARLLREVGFVDVKIYSIKDKVVLQYGDHVLKTAESAPPNERARRIRGVQALREKFMRGGDYVVVRAQKP